MILFPAIDLKGGACVRLLRGDMASATTFGLAPAAQARAWQEAGFAWLHVVDLDGAFAGRSVNREAVRAILGAITIPVQLGGGIRGLGDIEAWLDAGVARVILGSLAARAPALVREACQLFPGRIVIGIDARDGQVAVAGWAEATTLAATALAARLADAGAAAIVFTDIGRDGTLSGPNVEETLRVAEAAAPVPVIVSGGVGGLEHLRSIRWAAAGLGAGARIAGVIVGRALYDGGVDPAEARRALEG